MLKILKPGIALLIIAGVAAAILGYVNVVTTEPIAKAEAATKEEKMNAVLSCNSWGEEVAVDDDSIINSYTEGLDNSGNTAGYTFSVTTKGFSSGLNLMVGIDSKGVIQGVAIVSHEETAGLGANAEDPEWAEQFNGKSGELAVGTDIDAITGATITSKAITDAVNVVTNYFIENLQGGVN